MGLNCGTITILNRERNNVFVTDVVGLPRHLTKDEYLATCRPFIDEVIRSGHASVAAASPSRSSNACWRSCC